MWGHSRGASVTIAALTISDQIAAAVVYAPAPADLAQDYARRLRQSGGNPGSSTWPFLPDQNPDAYRRISPINYLDAVSAPGAPFDGLAQRAATTATSTNHWGRASSATTSRVDAARCSASASSRAAITGCRS